MDGKTCAIYIDGDNFKHSGIIELFNYIKKWNVKVLHKVVYGDFSSISMQNWRDTCLDYNLTSIHLWKKHSKNSVDMKMSCDIQELLYTRTYNIDIFILCTGDRDFVPIVEKIHTQEKIVIGMSTNFFGTSSMFKNECDQFYHLSNNSDDYMINDSDEVVDKRKIHKSYRPDDIKEEYNNLDLDTFFKKDDEYIQKLKNIIKNGKYVSVLTDIVKTPDEKDMMKKVVNDMNENPQLITKLKSVSKDIKEIVKEDMKKTERKKVKEYYREKAKKEKEKEKEKEKGFRRYMRLKEKEKENRIKNMEKKSKFNLNDTKNNYFKNVIVKKNKVKEENDKPSTKLFESETIDDLLNNIDFEEIKFKENNEYTMERIKDFVINFLKNEDKSVFVSQIKDEILKVYPKFSEKDFGYTGFTSFMKALEPEVKTESKGVGILHAYV